MGPARKRGAKGAKSKNELSLGDLVLAKVKGFPAWPAKISRPEDWKCVPDPKKYFVQFFGTSEIAFVAPADIQAFTIEAKNKLSARCQGKTVKYFVQAVKEICEQYAKLQHESSSGTRDDNSEQTFASEHSTDPVVNDSLEVSEKVGIEINESHCKTEINGLGELGSRLEHCSQRQGETESQDIKPYLSGDVDHNLSPCVSSGKIKKLSKDLTNLPSNVKKESSDNVRAEGRHSDSGQSKSANGHQKKLAMGSKKKPECTVHKNSSSSVPHEHTGDRMQRKLSSDSNTKVSSAGNSKSVLVVGKERRVVVDKTHSDPKDNGQVEAEINLEPSEVISRKRMKTQHGSEKQAFQTCVTTCPAKMPKCTYIGNDASMSRSQSSRKNDSRSPNVLDGKMSDIELKRSTSDWMLQNQLPSRIQINNESNHFSNEDGLRATKCHLRAFEPMPSSAMASESKLEGSVSHKKDSVRPNKVRSPVTQLPSKRRAVRLYDDDDDKEIPRTPVHGGFTNKVFVTPRAPDSEKKSVVHGKSCVNYQMFSSDKGTIEDRSKEQAQCARVSNEAPSPNFQLGLVKMAGELSAAHVSPSLSHLDDEKLPSMEIRLVSVTPDKSPRSITGTRPLAEQQNINFSKESGNVSQKKAPAGDNRVLPTASDRLAPSPHEVITDRSNPTSSREKRNVAVKSDSRIDDSSLTVGHPNKNIVPVRERVDVGKHDETSSLINAKIPESVMSMKHLIAAAQARKREAHLQSSYRFLFPHLDNEAESHRKSSSPAPGTTGFESSSTQQLDVQGLRSISPSADVHHLSSTSQRENQVLEERMLSSSDHAIGCPLSGGTEAAVARDAFEGMIETLSRTKESIGRATRLAIDCAKYGIANEVVELLIHKLENEPSLHHRVDLFFLVDSITQFSHSQKGIASSSYIPTVQVALDRLIGAAAPPGAGAEENRRQVRKVLRLWIERKILPESVLRRYIDDIGVANDDTSAGLLLQRPSRAERAIDDPLREMEGMFVDEYGSNATFQLPGLLSSRLFEEEEEEEDSFQAEFCKEIADTSPSKRSPVIRDPENCTVTPSDRRHQILEDVDGELEMEDVSGNQITDGTFEVASLEPNSDGIFTSASNKIAEWLDSPEGSPPLPPGSPPVTPPLPTSPSPSLPPLPPPLSLSPPPPPPPPLLLQQIFPPLPIGRPPPVFCHQSLSPQPVLISQHMPSLPSSISTSSTLAFQPPRVLHEIGGTLTGNRHAHMVSSTQGFHIDASVRSEALSQQSSCFPAAGVGKAVEHIGFNSSRTVEYKQCDAYMNLQSLQPRQLPGGAPFAHRPLHPEPPPQHPPTHFSYPKASVQQHHFSPCLLPNFSDISRRYGADESWRMQVNEFSDSPHVGWMSTGRSCSGPLYPYEGYFEPPQERPLINAVNFRPPTPNSVAAATQISVIPGRPDMSAVNWKPA